MAQYDDEYDEDDQGPADLRKALAKAKRDATEARKEKEEMAKQLADLSIKVKSNTLAGLLQAKGVNPKAAKFLQSDNVEATPEAVDAWLAENGEFLNLKPKSETSEGAADEQASGPTDGMKALLDALANNRELSQDSSATADASEQTRLAQLAELGKSVKSESEITAALIAMGAPVSAPGY